MTQAVRGFQMVVDGARFFDEIVDSGSTKTRQQIAAENQVAVQYVEECLQTLPKAVELAGLLKGPGVSAPDSSASPDRECPKAAFPQKIEEKEYYSTKEVATKLSVSIGTVQNLVRTGKLRTVNIGRVVKFPQEEIARYKNSLRANSGLPR